MIASGCAGTSEPLPCARLGGVPMLEYHLFFGRGISGRPDLTEREWAEFLQRIVTPNLPDGFTVFDAYGQWMQPATQRVAKENTKVIVVAVPDTEAARSAITVVKDAYRSEFHQQSVGTTVQPACGAF
jgi:hypothetical protein